MNYGSLYAFLTAVGFKTNLLAQRFLEEKGANQIDTYTIYRFALIPALIWALIFVRPADIVFILHSPELLVILAVVIVLWNLQAFLMSLVINATNSMVLFTTIFTLMSLPLFLGFGAIYNHDKPGLLSIAAILILMVALLVKPTAHEDNPRPHLSKPLLAVVALIFAKAFCDTVLQGVGREALKQIQPTVFLGVFSVLVLTVCTLISTLYVKPHHGEAVVMKERQWLAVLLMPMTWFLASIPEAFALASIPIYTFISISVITFGMDTVSDVIHKRIRLNLQTVSFLGLVVAGVGFSITSV